MILKFLTALCLFVFLLDLGALWTVNEDLVSSRTIQQSRFPIGFKLFIAANLYNCESIVPHFNRELKRLAFVIGYSNVYISIYENGSIDRTKEYLHDLQYELDALGVANRIVMEPSEQDYARRIPYLAPLRNIVLEPMQEWIMDQSRNVSETDQIPAKILFLNDVFWTAEDAITLLHTQNFEYDAACAVDMSWNFYDTFATRDVVADVKQVSYPPTGTFPYFYNNQSIADIQKGHPARVFSCWNGMVALNHLPFTRSNLNKVPVVFRALFAEVDVLEYEASECCLVFADLQKSGYSRVYMNPQVQVYYEGAPGRWWYWILSIWNWTVGRWTVPKVPLHSREYAKWQDAWEQARDDGVDVLDRVCVQPVNQ